MTIREIAVVSRDNRYGLTRDAGILCRGLESIGIRATAVNGRERKVVAAVVYSGCSHDDRAHDLLGDSVGMRTAVDATLRQPLRCGGDRRRLTGTLRNSPGPRTRRRRSTRPIGNCRTVAGVEAHESLAKAESS